MFLEYQDQKAANPAEICPREDFWPFDPFVIILGEMGTAVK